MGISKDLLGADEHVILHLRTHAKALLGPATILILLGAAAGVVAALFPPEWTPLAYYIEAGVLAILLIWLVIAPFVAWFSTTYTITDRRVITRTGILTKRGHDVPLRRINNVNYEHSLSDRMFGCGTLIFETAAGKPLVLSDVPRVERVHVMVTELLFEEGPEPDHRELGE
ncbi:MAG TPA: PH domain-containing protein [Arachnia sp.]|nr:PH domain-containing protein [Arachnia sp.]HMT87833.1 PH domain-containing protein [Arachnia sp.]